MLAPLEDALSESTIAHVDSTYIPAVLGTATHPTTGVLYGLPLTVDFPTIQYRKDLAEEAGYDPEAEDWSTEPMRWQEFAEVVADVWEYHGGEDEYTYGFTTQAQAYEGLSCCSFYETMSSFGGAYFGEQGNLYGPVGDRPVTVDEAPVLDAARMMRSFMHGPDADDTAPGYPRITTDDITEFDEEGTRKPFTGGDALFMRNWPYAIDFHAEEADFEVGTMPLPYGVEAADAEYEGGSCHTGSTQHLVLNPHAESREASLAVLEAFTDESVQRTILEVTGKLPPDADVIETANPAVLGPLGDHLDTLVAAAERTIPRPGSPAWSDQSIAIREAVHDAYTGERTPEAALSELATKIE